MPRLTALIITGLAILGAAGGQVPAASQSADGRDVRLTLREGTSMAAALSPDGRTLVIDLLGALWTLSSDGGAATRILEDGYDAHAPAWSPDGKRIAFQAYRDNSWNIWTINADGSALNRETSGAFDDREPHWSRDGAHLAFSSDRSGNYDIWTIAVGSASPQRITRDDANEYMPAWSPDGREIAYVSDRKARGLYAVDLSSRAERLVHADTRTLAGPSWSSDGRRLAYVAIDGATAHLLVTGPEATDRADANEDVFPFRAQWTTAGELLYTADGKIKTRPASGGPARIIEFAADVSFTRPAFTARRIAFPSTAPQPVRGIMHPVISPDGSRIAFAALGDLWLSPTTPGDVTPARVTNDRFIETDPAWSPDGKHLAFSSDRDGTMDLWLREIESGLERKLAPRAMAAAWSPNGSRIAYLDPESQLQIVEVGSGEVRRAHERVNEPGRPSWLPGGRAIVMGALRPYSTRFREGTNQILMVPVDLGDNNTPPSSASDRWFNPLPHKSIGMREDSGPAWSPDGQQLAAIVDGYLTVLPITAGTPQGQPRRLSNELANSPSWTRDSQQLLYQHAGGFGLVNLRDGSVRQIRPRLSWTPPPQEGTTVVHAGRLFDGRADLPLENVDIVIEGHRISRIVPHHADVHTGRIVDASSGTVLPGLIESHTHMSKRFGEALGRAWLAFGITSIRNPAAHAFEAIEDREAIASGARIGPRVVATGEPFDGTRIYYPGGSSLDDPSQLAERMTRAQELGFDFIKTYVRLPDVLQQRVIDAAHRVGLPVTSHEIYPAVAYGADGVEHIRGTSRRGYSPKMSELRRSYADVVSLLTASKMTLTPTIGIQGGFPILTLRDSWWLRDPRMQLFPASTLNAGRALTQKPADARDLAEREALVIPQERLVSAIVRGGGRVVAGTDSPINPYGVSLLTELEHFVRGGLSPAEAIRSATIVPAEAMGLGAEIGSIEAGKLADLIVVDGDPLADITHLRRTRYTVKGGIVYRVDAIVRE